MSRLVDSLRALVARVPRGMMLGLDRVEDALAAMGDPHLGLPAVHIAGSNGKGSTAAMVEAVCREAGLRTGLYSSPHLCRFAERIRVAGEPIGDDAFAASLDAVMERCRPDLTFFESLTVAAFTAFKEAKIDVAVIEVGLGGRLDATNVIRDPIVTAITSISLEHTDILGETVDAIAREKAGIFKAGAPFVLGPLGPEAAAAIDGVAARVRAGPGLRVSRGEPGAARDAQTIHVSYDGWRTRLQGPSPAEDLTVELGLRGAHQAENAGVAAGIVRFLADRFPDRDLRDLRDLRGPLARGLAGAEWPGRCERISRDGITVVLDAAHNPEGVGALLRAHASEPARTALVFGALADKQYAEMLRALAPLATRRYYTEPKGRAPAPLAELASIAEGAAIPEPREAITRALAESAPGDTVLATGSIYLVGELRAALLGITADPVIAL